jgi:hypothetical protein
MNPLFCSREEDVVRAISDAHWDSEQKRYNSYLFSGTSVSMARLVVFGLETLFEIFHRDLDRPFKSKVISVGEINVGKLQEIGNIHTKPISLSVKITPRIFNPAHAEIPEKISRGLALKIIERLNIHQDSPRKKSIKLIPFSARMIIKFICVRSKMIF